MKKRIILTGLSSMLIIGSLFTSCMTKTTNDGAKAGITKLKWDKVDTTDVDLYTLTNKNGVQVQISNYGGKVTSWITPDKNGKPGEIVLGFNSATKYNTPKVPYFGALIGRYGNRIAAGKFTLDGKTYTLATNDNKINHLHGGNKGFDKVIWTAGATVDSIPALTLTYLSKDGEEGYPGNLKVTVKYTLTDDDALKIEYTATTDKPTPINLTNHSYFNLSGDVTNTVLDEEIQINADRYTPVNAGLIPTGELKAVKGTPFDFTKPIKIGLHMAEIKNDPIGYDHNFILNDSDSTKLHQAAVVYDSISGRQLEVLTTQPAIQFYTGNFLNGDLVTNDGKKIQQHAALCLETQHYPDSPNQPKFPNTILRPGQVFNSTTVYKVSIRK